jgi:hypothetical protein
MIQSMLRLSTCIDAMATLVECRHKQSYNFVLAKIRFHFHVYSTLFFIVYIHVGSISFFIMSLPVNSVELKWTI